MATIIIGKWRYLPFKDKATIAMSGVALILSIGHIVYAVTGTAKYSGLLGHRFNVSYTIYGELYISVPVSVWNFGRKNGSLERLALIVEDPNRNVAWLLESYTYQEQYFKDNWDINFDLSKGKAEVASGPLDFNLREKDKTQGIALPVDGTYSERILFSSGNDIGCLTEGNYNFYLYAWAKSVPIMLDLVPITISSYKAKKLQKFKNDKNIQTVELNNNKSRDIPAGLLSSENIKKLKLNTKLD